MGGIGLYLAAINLFLNSGLLPRLISVHPDRILAGWRWAWTVRPGFAHVRGFYLRGQLQDAQFEVTVDDAYTRVNLRALLGRRFHTEWIEAKGVEFRVRPRVLLGPDTADEVSAYPSIQGLAELPLREAGVPLPEGPAEQWTVQLEGVQVAEVRELWMASHRFRGEATVVGRLVLHPGRTLEMGPATMQLVDGVVTVEDRPMAGEVRGQVAGALEAADLKSDRAMDLLRQLDATVNLSARIASLGLIGYPFDRWPMEIEGGIGQVELGVGLQHGYFTAGSRLKLEGKQLAVKAGGYLIRADVSALGLIQQQAGALKGSLAVTLHPLVLSSGGKVLLETAGVTLTGRATNLSVGMTPADGALDLEMTRSAPADLTLLNRWIDAPGVKVLRGTGTLDAHLSMGKGAKTQGGWLTVATDLATVQWDELTLSGKLKLAVDLGQLKFQRQSANLSGTTLALSEVSVKSPRIVTPTTRSWEGKVVLHDAQLRLAAPFQVRARVEGHFSDARPILSLLEEKGALPGWVTGFLEAKGLKVSGAVDDEGPHLALKDLVLDGEGVQMIGAVHRNAKALHALFLATVGPLSAGIRLADDKVQVQVVQPTEWFHAQMRAYEASRAARVTSAR